MHRENTRRVYAGGLAIGGGAPVTVQSMTNTRTGDTDSSILQIARLAEAGCDIVRVAVPDETAARSIGAIKSQTDIPIVADIHFDYKLALLAVAAGADKIRINPGNLAPEGVGHVASACRGAGIPIRIGVNGGSLERALLESYGGVTPEALAESALREIKTLNQYDFDDICVSIKASDALRTIEACRIFASRADYPMHLGITEAGGPYTGLIRSCVGIGTLLAEGIGDTIRVSLTADPVEEVRAGIEILKAAGLRRGGLNLISCPTCGRCNIDLISVAGEVGRRLSGIKRELTVAVMGCAVNGPGEARQADYGIAGALGHGVLFKKGKIVGKAPAGNLAEALIELIESENN